MNILINWLNGNEGVIASFNLITTIITCFIFLGILFLTVIYAGSTVYLAYKTSKSVEITKEKEKIDRALDYTDKFDYKRLMDLRRLKAKEKGKDIRNFSKGLSNLYYLIRYFDKSAILYFNEKINEEIFEGYIEPMLINFACGFKNEICNELKELKEGKGVYWYINFARLADKVLLKSKYKHKLHLAIYATTREYKKIVEEE